MVEYRRLSDLDPAGPADGSEMVYGLQNGKAVRIALAKAAMTGRYEDLPGLQAALDSKAGGGQRNPVINGCMRVASRPAQPVTGAWRHGPIDLLAVRANGTVSAGTVQQYRATSLATSGWACQIAGLTIGAGGSIAWRHRIEARDANGMRHCPATLSCRFYHEAGFAVPVTLNLARAGATDNFTTVAAIGSGTTSVANATETTVTLTVETMGECSDGIEIQIVAATGAVTARNFWLTDLQLEAASAATPFERRPIALEQTLTRRHVRLIGGLMGKANSGTNMQIALSHPGMRAAPSYSATAPLCFTDCVTADFTQSAADINTVHEATPDHGRVSCGYFTGMSAGMVLFQRGTGGLILATCEL